MNKPLVIVESPTKEKSLRKYLGKDYNVTSTVGHIMDLPEKEIGIDIENDFEPKYVTIKGKQKVIRTLKSAAKDSDDIYLAPDPDREGEAIAFHTADVLKKKGRRFHRVLFHEITKKGVIEALSAPELLNLNKYKAQQTRRILDRLVGYQISPVLWKKVKYGLSAGRVQSVAVRIICERERAIHAFDPVEYWSVTAFLEGDQPPEFPAKLVKKNGKKIKIGNQQEADTVLSDLSDVSYIVDEVAKKIVKRNPYPPFITSKLQQEAIRKLRFSAKKTMVVAQQLYEGINLGSGEYVGLITYMRTDSTRIAEEAALEALDLIKQKYGPEYALSKPRFFKNKNKAQDAHEAIRPTSVNHTPEKVAQFLTKDQLALYQLIWKRFMASQMAQALINQNSISINAGDYTFSVTGSTIKFPGFMALYITVDDEEKDSQSKEKAMLPELAEKMVLKLNKIDPKQHFTSPPPRFSEASLVKELEENGIGRPSTYASILSTIRDKGYVEFQKGYFRPSELGFIVSDLLVENFPDILSVDFTAKMENDLDLVETAETDASGILSRFYNTFEKHLASASDNMLSVKGVGVPTNLPCPLCAKELHVKVGKNGPFLACEGYPECNYSRNYIRDEKGNIQALEPDHEAAEGETCDQCGKPMVVKQGRYGDFLACSGYPECKKTRSISSKTSAQSTGVKCPEKDCDGELVERTSKRGKVFYGCSRFPKCNFATWDKPIAKPCPDCGAEIMVEKETKRDGKVIKCLVKECGYSEEAGKLEG
ncbi:MAG: type I DNA topoisomerase [Desulfobacteraceae bacterium]|nr:type I DNA topoisomerase [Desulfobacteraceae bacterium]MBC2756410.1 type I DNA topoisomerase [Desulfobacteraceae bacterium]MBC2763540.1 type I DNA topoisomerase [ANME-2 cluster archaeon]